MVARTPAGLRTSTGLFSSLVLLEVELRRGMLAAFVERVQSTELKKEVLEVFESAL